MGSSKLRQQAVVSSGWRKSGPRATTPLPRATTPLPRARCPTAYSAHHGYSPRLLTTVTHHGYSPLLRRQVACAVIEEALQHGLATKISRKEVPMLS